MASWGGCGDSCIREGGLYPRCCDRGAQVTSTDWSNPPAPAPCPHTDLSKHADPMFPHFCVFLEPSFLRVQSNRE